MNSNLAYQENFREELIGGKVVMMAPASAGHTYIADNILAIFKHYLKGANCIPFGDGLLVHLTDKDKFVPDVMVVCDRSKIKPDGVYGAPDLVVEVLSRSIGLSAPPTNPLRFICWRTEHIFCTTFIRCIPTGF